MDIALNSKEEAVALSSIAERQNISMSYLEQLIAKLKKAEIVNSTRGAKGGYILAKAPEKISVGDILRALEGNLHPVDCSEVIGGEPTCNASDICVTKYVWKRISDSINDAVDTLMLSELVLESERLSDKNGSSAGESKNIENKAEKLC